MTSREQKDPQRPHTLRLSPEDDVALALKELEPGTRVDHGGPACRDRVPAGHKVAVRKISAREPVRKYGQIIGFASQDILPGSHVHDHNLMMGDFFRDYAIGRDARTTRMLPHDERAVFNGIRRQDGRVGTRNYIGILPTVSCSSGVARQVAHAVTREELDQFPHVDGLVSLGHGSGCCLVPGGEGHLLLQRTLAGYARHPNFAGVVMIGLGCELNQLDDLLENMDLDPGPSLCPVGIQDGGGTTRTVDRAVAAVRDMLPLAEQATRSPAPASHLVLGLECGGSDAYSGITANPALGVAADLLVRNGGTVVLSETPEIYGAEHLLTRRAVSATVGEKLIRRVRWWEHYTAQLGGEIDNNPTPGNKAGGLTTILEKSLGALAKAGTSNLTEVYGYADPVSAKGLVFMDTPGYDVVSVTGMIAGGANLICFTTGRGTVCAFKPAPTIKLASNTGMYQHLKGDMDLNCGRILDGEATINDMGEALFQLILRTASGERTKSEGFDFEADEFVPWHIGPVL